MYQIRLLHPATRELEGLDESIGHRIVERLHWLAKNIDKIRPEPLTRELAGFFKLRVGDYRVIYEILHSEEIILVYAIGHRSKVYRKR